jgi:Flp pilus assembly protein TadG
MRALTSNERGQALIETAFSLTLLVILIFGVVEGSMMLYTYHYLSYAARLGTRYAIVRGSACAGLSNCPNATGNQIQTYVTGISAFGINSSNLSVTASWCTSSASPCTCAAPAGDPLCNSPGDQVQVTATYPFALSVPFLSNKTVSLTSSSRAIISQ